MGLQKHHYVPSPLRYCGAAACQHLPEMVLQNVSMGQWEDAKAVWISPKPYETLKINKGNPRKPKSIKPYKTLKP